MTIPATVPAGSLPPRRRGPRGTAAGRRWQVLLLVVMPALLTASCRIDGAAVIAPYRSPPMTQVTARPVSGTAGVLTLSPDGALQAVADARHGVCLQTTSLVAPPVCAGLPVGSAAVSAAFSADGRWLAVWQGAGDRSGGRVWLVDPRTGSARPVPAVDGRSAAAPATGTSGTSSGPTTAAPVPGQGISEYTGMVWAGSGDLLLISSSLEADGTWTRLVDLDPVSLVPRVVATATGPYEFQSGRLATGGSTVLFTVYRSDQLVPNLVDIDLVTGVRREFDPIGSAGTQLVPLAVSPDGRTAVVGSATLEHSGPPRLLDIASSHLTDIPGLTGDFGVAAFSPDGGRVAVVSTESDGKLSLALGAPGTAQPARALGAVTGPLPRAARLSWSRSDVVSVAGAAAPGPASVSGWRLTG